MRYKVLWVEDNAEADLFQYLAPVNVDGRFDMDIAVNATEACTRLSTNIYDVVIMDTRIPSGYEQRWQEREQSIKAQSPNPVVRLGLEVLKFVFGEGRSQIKPEHHEKERYCIFSIDPQGDLVVNDELLNTFKYERKNAAMPRNILVNIIRDSLFRQGRPIK
jgi:CheY-like chemotaxis protein